MWRHVTMLVIHSHIGAVILIWLHAGKWVNFATLEDLGRWKKLIEVLFHGFFTVVHGSGSAANSASKLLVKLVVFICFHYVLMRFMVLYFFHADQKRFGRAKPFHSYASRLHLWAHFFPGSEHRKVQKILTHNVLNYPGSYPKTTICATKHVRSVLS